MRNVGDQRLREYMSDVADLTPVAGSFCAQDRRIFVMVFIRDFMQSMVTGNCSAEGIVHRY